MRNVTKLVLAALGLVVVAGSARAEWGTAQSPQGAWRPRLSFWSKPFFAQKARRDQARWQQMWQEYQQAQQQHQQQMSMMPRPAHPGYPVHTGVPVVYQHPVATPHAMTIQVSPAKAETSATPKGVATVTDRK